MFGNLSKGAKGKKGKIQSVEGGLTTEPTTSVSSDSSNSSHQNDCMNNFKLSPPKSNKDITVPMEDAKKRMKDDGLGKYLNHDNEGSDETKMLIWLYGRGCFGESNKKVRNEKLMAMVANKNKKKRDEEEESPPIRLMRVLRAKGDKDLTESHDTLWCNYNDILKQYFAQDGALGFLEDMSQAKYFFRIQKSGNCFLQAPCVMLAYLAQKHNIKGIVGPVDVSKYIRRSFCDEALYEYIVNDKGGNSQDVLTDLLKSLTGPEPDTRTDGVKNLQRTDFDLEFLLREYGPALLSKFTVHSKFGDSAIGGNGYFRFDGEVSSQGQFIYVKEEVEVDLKNYQKTTEKSHDDSQHKKARKEEGAIIGKHAMLLIGGRIERSTNKKWFLFQNWWEDMQLIEISETYLANCGGFLTFATDTDKLRSCNIDSDELYSMNEYKVAESNNLEKADNGRNASFLMQERLNFRA